MNKLGHPYHRRNAAALARELRAMWPDLKGDWTRRDWNQKVLAAAHNHITGMGHFDRANGIVRRPDGTELPEGYVVCQHCGQEVHKRGCFKREVANCTAMAVQHA